MKMNSRMKTLLELHETGDIILGKFEPTFYADEKRLTGSKRVARQDCCRLKADELNLRELGYLIRNDLLYMEIGYSSYSDGSMATSFEVANFRYFEKTYPESFICIGYGGYSGKAAAFSVQDLLKTGLWASIMDDLKALSNYPLLDEDLLCLEVEPEIFNDSWQSYLEEDFLELLASKLDIEFWDDLREMYPAELFKRLLKDLVDRENGEICYMCDDVEIHPSLEKLVNKTSRTWIEHYLNGHPQTLPLPCFDQDSCVQCGERIQ